MEKDYKKYLIIPDMHCDHEDYRALHGVYEFGKAWKPDKIILMGDGVDFYAVSSFDKNPDKILSLQKEIDVLHYHLKEIRKFYKGDITYLQGNHEERLLRYLKKNPEMSSLRSISSIPQVLQLDKFDVDYKLSEENHGVLFKHGDVVRKHSAYTAKAEMETEGTSGGSGHTHRMSSHYKTDRSGQHAWFEFGHLCDEKQAEYIKGVANWQKGFGTMIYNKTNKTWSVNQHLVVNNSFEAYGKFYSWRANASYPERENIQ